MHETNTQNDWNEVTNGLRCSEDVRTLRISESFIKKCRGSAGACEASSASGGSERGLFKA